MNKHLHRVVFNAARGLRMVVQETARSTGKATGATSGVLATALAGLLAVSPAPAQIVGAPGVAPGLRPTVLVAPNGVPLVNIQTPSAAGVSRNLYNQFDVQRGGVILNNSRSDVQTQLGGWVQANPYLATGPARIILNEVVSGNPTQLRGATLPDGSAQRVLVPQVYVRVRPGDIDGSGALLSAEAVKIRSSGDVTNTGTIAGRTLVSINADTIHNLGGRISGGSVDLQARTDLNSIGATIDARDALSITAGRDIHIRTTTTTHQVGLNSDTRIDRVAGLYVSNPGGTLVASAGHDVNLVGAIVANQGPGGLTSISAKNDIHLQTVRESRNLMAQARSMARPEPLTDKRPPTIVRNGELLDSEGNLIGIQNSVTGQWMPPVLALPRPGKATSSAVFRDEAATGGATAGSATANSTGKIAGELTGTPTRIRDTADASEIRSLTRENESARILANHGFKVEQNPTVPGPKKPDLRINGEIFDNYAPTSNYVRNIADAIRDKVNSRQADNVVVNLADTYVTPTALQEQLANYPIPGLKQVIIVDRFSELTIINITGK
ncbi:ESPR-type extended signal peptide-containing protein [Variovorax guangxiensis]|uniref:CdiA C-terminal domain-containing protein n=1 Tax=Variovorax guangxiensis TaxID=1775474 RepID=UPI002865BCEA|nr:ESPR-type extended signal peptide-containing protein [Variovorax guangxiensis]MDR6856822.1 filamentous hemagglutinin family protein [Variovorax guangxiensis]